MITYILFHLTCGLYCSLRLYNTLEKWVRNGDMEDVKEEDVILKNVVYAAIFMLFLIFGPISALVIDISIFEIKREYEIQ